MTQLQRPITAFQSHFPYSDWQSLLRDNVTDLAELSDILRIPSSITSKDAAAIQSLNVTRDYLSRIQPGNPNDPLLLQILPRQEELEIVAGFSNDPLDETSCIQQTSLADHDIPQRYSAKIKHKTPNNDFCLPILQKYPGRALIFVTDRCASHCRFCFRRHFLKKKSPSFSNHRIDTRHIRFSTEFENDSDEVREFILSGGDPLMLDDADLDKLFHYIKNRHPGNRVRLHTRMPIMLPERVTPQLVEMLRHFRHDPAGGAVYVVLHINHRNELSDKVVSAIASIVDAGIPVLSQTVLLRNVNDRFETLLDLFEKLVDIRVIPYYLHQLDRVQGAAHFEVPTVKGQVLVSKLSLALPGYAVPGYVREIPGEFRKTRL